MSGTCFFVLFCLFWVPPLGLSASPLLPLPTHTHVAATHIYMHSVSTHALTHTYARAYADTRTHARTHAHSRTHACTHARTHARTMLPKHRTSPHDHRSVVKHFTRRDSSQVKTRSVARIPDGPKCLTQSTAASFWIHTRIEKNSFPDPHDTAFFLTGRAVSDGEVGVGGEEEEGLGGWGVVVIQGSIHRNSAREVITASCTRWSSCHL